MYYIIHAHGTVSRLCQDVQKCFFPFFTFLLFYVLPDGFPIPMAITGRRHAVTD